MDWDRSGSELIAFCDQDDRWYPHKLAVIVEAFACPDVLLAYHNADVVGQDGTRLGSLSEYRAKRRTNAAMSLGPWTYALGFTQVFRRSMLELSRFWPDSLDHNTTGERMAHDQWYFFSRPYSEALSTITSRSWRTSSTVEIRTGWNASTSPSARSDL